jgi:hypothetical protein
LKAESRNTIAVLDLQPILVHTAFKHGIGPALYLHLDLWRPGGPLRTGISDLPVDPINVQVHLGRGEPSGTGHRIDEPFTVESLVNVGLQRHAPPPGCAFVKDYQTQRQASLKLNVPQ